MSRTFQGARVWVKDPVNVWKSATVTKDYDGGDTLSVEGDEDAQQGRRRQHSKSLQILQKLSVIQSSTHIAEQKA